MAFRVPSSPGLAHDRDPETFIGIEYPLKRGDGINGYFESTTTTLQAAKTNVRMLLETSQGERLMQPQLGTGLRRYLFEHDRQYTRHKCIVRAIRQSRVYSICSREYRRIRCRIRKTNLNPPIRITLIKILQP